MGKAGVFHVSVGMALLLATLGCAASGGPSQIKSENMKLMSDSDAPLVGTPPSTTASLSNVPIGQASQSIVPPARDPQIAVQEEFDAAVSMGTIDAWDLFLKRHKDNELAASAERELEKLKAAKKLKK